MANCNLRWENYSTHFRNTFYELLNSNLYTDVTLICDDKKQLNAHKIVLASCNVFKNFITELPEGTKPFIYLRGIQVKEMKSILEFIYLGETSIQQSRLEEMSKVAKNLELHEISKTMNSIIEDSKLEQSENSVSKNQSNEENYSSSENSIEDFSLLDEILKESSENFVEDKKDNCVSNDEKDENELMNENVTQPLNKLLGTNDKLEEESVDDIVEIKDANSEEMKVKELVEHNADGNIICNHCKYKTKDKSNMKKHVMAKHHGRKFACSFCDKTFPDQSQFKRHIEAVHEGVKYACVQCTVGKCAAKF